MASTPGKKKTTHFFLGLSFVVTPIKAALPRPKLPHSLALLSQARASALRSSGPNGLVPRLPPVCTT
ncbi:hypothetical protein MCOR07_001999 [Pyricularia oryzae]|nr:hypothetical protein MCOR07_001999 [Pyricularia oryzae]